MTERLPVRSLAYPWLRLRGLVRRLSYRGMVYLCAALVAFICTAPFLWMASTAFKPPREVLTWPPIILPKNPTLNNFVVLFRDSLFTTFLQNSLVTAFGSTAISITIAVLGAYSLTRYTYRGRNQMATFVLLGYMFPPIVLIIPFFVWFYNMGLTDNYLGLVLAYVAVGLPFAVWLLWAFFQSIPLELEEAAWIDGATRARAIWHVIVPLAIPGVIATSIFTFIVAWNDYLFSLVLMSTDPHKTLTVGLADLLERPTLDWGVIMAAGVLITIPALIFFVITQNYLIKGWGAGAVKG